MPSPPADAVEIACQGERLVLHPERAVHWPARRTLLVADVHLGKEDAFGRRGVAIPRGPSEGDLERLAALVAATGAERLCVLGDFMHAVPRADEPWLAALAAFLDGHASLAVEVVAGNHDRAAGRPLVDGRVRWIDGSVREGPFVLRHEPGEDARGYVLAGHVHPACRIGGGRRGESLRAPVFWFRERGAVLPAFGAFTGGETVRPARGERVYLAAHGCVVPLSAAPRRTLADGAHSPPPAPPRRSPRGVSARVPSARRRR